MKERLTLILSVVVYLLCNLRLIMVSAGTLEVNLAASLKATAWWLLYTAPFYLGISFLVIVFMQAILGGEKLPWDRRLRVFLAVGMISGFIIGTWENMGANLWKHVGMPLA